jgi:hypothetical protein
MHNTNTTSNESLKDRIMPILLRVKAKDIIEIDGAVRAKIWQEASEGGLDYQFIQKDSRVLYFRLENPSIYNSFDFEEVEIIHHYLFPLMKKVNAPKCMDIRRDDAAVRLHLLLPGDTLLSVSRIVYNGAGAQKTMDYYTVR